MSGFVSGISGAGAVLVCLVQIGARAGLSAEVTLLHVPDRAPRAVLSKADSPTASTSTLRFRAL